MAERRQARECSVRFVRGWGIHPAPRVPHSAHAQFDLRFHLLFGVGGVCNVRELICAVFFFLCCLLLVG